MSYRPTLVGEALAQFADLQDDSAVYDALMSRIVELTRDPWDAWAAYPAGGEPEFRQTQFGGQGLLSFRVDEDAGTLIIFDILWAG